MLGPIVGAISAAVDQSDNFAATQHRVEHSFDKNGYCVWCTKSKMYHSNPPKTPYCDKAPPKTVEFWRKGAVGEAAKRDAAAESLNIFQRAYNRGRFA